MRTFRERCTTGRKSGKETVLKNAGGFIHPKNFTNTRNTHQHVPKDEPAMEASPENEKASISLQAERTELESQMYRSIVALNQNYFYDKVKVTDETKPCQHKLKIPCPTASTNYSQEFRKKKKNYKTHLIVNNDYETDLNIKGPYLLTTNYHEDFKIRRGKQSEEKNKKLIKHNYIREKQPNMMESKYTKDFLNWGAAPLIDPIRPTSALTIFGKGNFSSATIYQSDFKTKFGTSSIKENLDQTKKKFPVFSGIKPQYRTNYFEAFHRKKGGRLPSRKASDNVIMNLTAQKNQKLKTDTQYKMSFTDNWLNKSTHPEEKNLQQLQDMVLKA